MPLSKDGKKLCATCLEVKTVDEFRKDASTADRLRSDCRLCQNQKSKEYAAKNRDKAWAATKKWREKNRDRHLEKRREWATSEKGRATARRWVDVNRADVYLYNRARKAMRRGMRTAVTLERINELLKLQRSKCSVCHVGLKDGYHIDHVMPIALGGDSSPGNLQLLCPHCNCSKKAQHPVDFMQRRGLLL